MEEQTRNADSRIKSYIDTIDALNKKESAARSLTMKLKQELDSHYKELSLLRSQLNSRKLELEQETAKSTKLERDLLEAKTAGQILRGKLESLEKRFKEEKVRWEEQSYCQESEIKKSELLSAEVESLRRRIEKSESEMSKLRIENGRLKEEEKARSSLVSDSSRESFGSNKRELLEEIEKKNSELQAALKELRNKQLKIDELNSMMEEMSTKIRSTEKELLLVRSSSQSSMPGAQNEPFNNTTPVNLSSSRPSMLGNYSSQQSSPNLLVLQQREQEIAELKQTVADLRKELESKTLKMQGLIQFLGDSESGFGEKERRLEKKVEQKDSELAQLRKEMVERDEEAGRLAAELEERLRMAETGKENADQALQVVQRELQEIHAKCSQLEASYQRLTSECQAKDADIVRLAASKNDADNELRALKSRVDDEVRSKDSIIDSLQREIADIRRKEESAQAKLTEVRALEDQIEYLSQQSSKFSTNLKRYQELANQMYTNSIKCDTVYKGGMTIFVKYARAVYIPLVFNYQPSASMIAEITRESSLETLESYCQKIRRLQEQVCAVSFVLDMTSVSPKVKKLLESNSMVAVCRVEDVVQEKVDLKTNKELVSFVQAGVVNKVLVEEVVCLMSASFDNAIDLSEFKQMESGAQNKTFQY